MGEGQFEVMKGKFGARVGRWLLEGLDSLVEERGCALQSEAGHGRASLPCSPVCHRPFPQELSVASPFPLLSENGRGEGGWWRMKALLELKKPTLILAGKGWSLGAMGCSGRGWKSEVLCLKLVGI